MMNPGETTNPRRSRRVAKWFGLSIVIFVILLIAVCFGSSAYVNRSGVPPELVNPPRELLPPPAPRPAKTPKPVNYDQFLAETLQRNPGRQDIRDVLDLARQFGESKNPVMAEWVKAIYKPEVTGTNVWTFGEPLRPAMGVWLHEHQDLVEQCLRAAEADLPIPPPDSRMSFPNSLTSYHYSSILEAELRSSLDRGDGERVQRITLAITNFLSRTLTRSSQLALNFLSQMTADNLLTTESLKRIRHVLADIHRREFEEAPILQDSVRQWGLEFRGAVVKKLNAPWDAYLEHKLSDRRYRFDINTRYLYLVNLPRPGMISLAVMSAMGRADSFKRQGAERLRQFDQYWPEVMAYAQLNYRELVLQPPLNPPWADSSFGRGLTAQYGGRDVQDQAIILKHWAATYYLREVHLNLLRAAVEWRLGNGWPQELDHDMTADRDNPRRDPFTDRPLRIDQTTTATIIYSLGPDLKDQHGRVSLILGPSSPVNLFEIPGDPAIWLRKR